MSKHEQRVWTAQCLCGPDRHCILAAYGEADSPEDAEITIGGTLRRQIADLVKSGSINPSCGLCNAPQAGWRIEAGRTRWRTLAEAQADPLFQLLRDGNALARALYGDLHRGRPN